jgi:hypothetical protein
MGARFIGVRYQRRDPLRRGKRPDLTPQREQSPLGEKRTMKAARFTEQQIIGVLRETEAGAKTKELWRRYGISDAMFCNWKAKYVRMTVI